jgi:hypothetical protein
LIFLDFFTIIERINERNGRGKLFQFFQIKEQPPNLRGEQLSGPKVANEMLHQVKIFAMHALSLVVLGPPGCSLRREAGQLQSTIVGTASNATGIEALLSSLD